MKFFVSLMLLIFSASAFIKNFEYLKYNIFTNGFSEAEYMIYNEYGYITKGNVCIIALIFGVISLIFLCDLAFNEERHQAKQKSESNKSQTPPQE